MTEKPSPPSPIAGGALIALCTLAGAVIGAVRGQPSLGFIVGVGVGAAGAIAIWLWDRRRSG